MKVPAYLKYIVLSILFVVATINVMKTTSSVIESSKRLNNLQNEVSSLEDEKQSLQEDLEYKKSDAFVEKEARDKLGLARPGEEIFVIKDVLGSSSHNDEDDGRSVDVLFEGNVGEWIALFL